MRKEKKMFFLSRIFKKLPDWLKWLLVGYGLYFTILYIYPDFFKDVNMNSIFFIGELFWKYAHVMKIIYILGNIFNIYNIIKFFKKVILLLKNLISIKSIDIIYNSYFKINNYIIL